MSAALAAHVSPVIARAAGDTIEDVVRALLPAARCNETIGAALLRLNPVGLSPTVRSRHVANSHIMRQTSSSSTPRRRSGSPAFAVVSLFFGVAFLDSLVTRSWGFSILFATLFAFGLIADRVRSSRSE